MSTLAWTINSRTDVVKEQQLNELALQLFAEHECTIIPRFPLVLVRILPRDQQQGGIWLPGGKQQNKPVYEGIVLRIWEPHLIKEGVRFNKWEDGLPNDGTYILESELTMGEHILFEHWAGFPVPGLHEDFYRMVPEFMNIKRENGPIFGKLVYQRERSKDVLNNIILNICASSEGASIDQVTEKLLAAISEEFDIARKVKSIKTVSGK